MAILFFTIFLTVFTNLVDLSWAEENNSELKQHKNWPILGSETCGRRIQVSEGVSGDSFPLLKTRILGGVNSTKRRLPWIVQQQSQSYYPFDKKSGRRRVETNECGGTVLTSRYVLTAAHCCQTNPAAVQTKFVINLNGDADNKDQPLPAERVVVHEQYDDETLQNDVCLIRLKKPIKFSDSVQPICLPTGREWQAKNMTGLNLIIAGWGVANSVERVLSPRLQEATIAVANDVDCQNQYKAMHINYKFHPKYQFCGGGAIKDACVGDSGGPAFYESLGPGPSRHYLLGLASYGVSCMSENRGAPGVYVKVASYIPWILDNISK